MTGRLEHNIMCPHGATGQISYTCIIISELLSARCLGQRRKLYP
jgi:hypothetical protein